jgi:hypothetical protein
MDVFDGSQTATQLTKAQVKTRLRYRGLSARLLAEGMARLAHPANRVPYVIMIDPDAGMVATVVFQGEDDYDLEWNFCDTDAAFDQITGQTTANVLV